MNHSKKGNSLHESFQESFENESFIYNSGVDRRENILDKKFFASDGGGALQRKSVCLTPVMHGQIFYE